MLENAVYSVISPEGCANILWRDPEKAAEAAHSLKLTAKNVNELGVIERIIPENSKDSEKMFKNLTMEIRNWYDRTSIYTPAELTERRYERFRRMGV